METIDITVLGVQKHVGRIYDLRLTIYVYNKEVTVDLRSLIQW